MSVLICAPAGLWAFSEKDLIQSIQNEVVSRNTGVRASEIEIRVLSLPRGFFQSGVKFLVKPKPGLRLLGNVLIPVQVVSTTGETHWVNIPTQIKAEVPVCVARRNISPKTISDPSMLETSTKNISALPSGFVRNCNEVLALETALNVQQGTVIYPYQFRPVPQIRAQDSIALQLNRDGVHLKMDGVALEDGYIGQIISVKSIHSPKKLKARVLSSGRVEVVD